MIKIEQLKLNYLQKKWLDLSTELKVNEDFREKYWKELVNYYSEDHRAYHNLNHLYELFSKLEKQTAFDSVALQLAIWYHDIIYQPLSKKNEEESAKLCEQRLEQLELDPALRQKIFKLIISTKKHDIAQWNTSEEKTDNKLLLDLDLSILGSTPQVYEEYTRQVRREYKIVPGILYRQGRRKVLRSFLDKPYIFKTVVFRDLYEQQARENLAQELEVL